MLITQSLETTMQDNKPQIVRMQGFHPVVLVVDDDESTRTLLRYLMEAEGYHVIEACDGKQAIAIHQNCRIDLVLLDGSMPNMDGFTCCQHLSTSPNNPGTPIMMLTSLNQDAWIDRAFAAGATDYLTKPFNWTLLQQRVRHLLQTRYAHVELQRQSQRSTLFKTIAQCGSQYSSQRISQRTSCSPHLEEVLNVAVAGTRRLLNVDRVLAYRFNPDRSGTICAESVDLQCQSLLGQNIQDPCFARQFDQLYRIGHIQIVEDIDHSNLPYCYVDLLAQFQVKAIVVVPILLPERLWGFLIAHHCASPRYWDIWEVELMEQLADQLSIAMQQVKFYQQMQQFSDTVERYVKNYSTKNSNFSMDSNPLAQLADLQQTILQARDLLSESQRLQTTLQKSNWFITA